MAAAVLLIAGCSDEPAAAPAPLDHEPATTASSAPSSEAPAPPLPAEAEGTSNAAAVAFVEHYIDVLNYTAATLDTRALDELSADDCEACQGIIARTKEMRHAGGRIEGGAWTISEVLLLATANDSVAPVQFLVDRDKEVTTDRAGAQPVEYPPSRVLLLLEARRTQDGWKAAGLERVDK